MDKLTFDLESRSKIDLTKCGMYVYAEDPSTDIMCFAFQTNNEEPFLWIPEKFRYLYEGPIVTKDQFQWAIDNADIIEAHNAGFEAIMWQEIMVKRYGFKPLIFLKLRCSAAKAAAMALPRKLEDACLALNLPQQKDTEGRRIMLKMCKPRKPTKNNAAIWHELPEDFQKLCNYCKQDIRAEYSLSESLPELSFNELVVWRHDYLINNRGVKLDLQSIESIKNKIYIKEQELLDKVDALTEGKIRSVRQIAATRKWLEERGLKLKKLTKDSVNRVLKKEIPLDCRMLLEIRQQLGKASVSKFNAMERNACSDERSRGSLLYYGASTGRWSGKGIQPQNYPRDSYKDKDIDSLVSMDNDSIEIIYDNVFTAASKCLRGMLISDKGKKLFCADFSSIEARVLAWIAKEMWVIRAFNKGLDLYKVNASEIYETPYENVTSEQRQIGKIGELALGFQGWLGAFQAMAEGYGVKLDEDRVKQIILTWRNMRPNIVALWKNLEMCAMQTVRTKKVYSYGLLKFGIKNRFLHMRLPSGRLLSYYDPKIQLVEPPYGEKREAITFMGTNSVTRKWERQSTYGGKLTENAVQAIARDLLAEAMWRVEEARFPVVLHVHDEIISEVEENKTEKDFKIFKEAMAFVPEWAEGCPIKAEGWIGHRYRK